MSKKKRQWQMLFKGDIQDFDPAISMKYWSNRSSTEKFRETKNLINQAMKIKGKSLKNASRLLRSTAVLKRQ